MLDLSDVMKTIKEIEGLGFKTTLKGEYIICEVSKNFQLRIIPQELALMSDRNELDAVVYAPSEATLDEPTKFAFAEYNALKALRKTINNEKVWATVVEMIFTVNSLSISSKIKAVEKLLRVSHDSSPNEEKPKKQTSKKSEKTKITKIPTKDKDDESEIFRAVCLEQIKDRLGVNKWVAKKNSVFSNEEGTIGVLCLVSKSYSHNKAGPDFWYGYHLEQRQLLSSFDKQYIVFGFKDEKELVLMPAEFVNSQSEHLHITNSNNGKMYWHIRIYSINGKYHFAVPHKGKISVEEFAMHGAKAAQETKPAAPVVSTNEVSLIKISSSNFKTIKKKH